MSQQPYKLETGWDTDDSNFYVELAIYFWADDDAPVIERVEILLIEDYDSLGNTLTSTRREQMNDRERKTYDALLLDTVQQRLRSQDSDLLEDLGKAATGARR